MLYLLIIEALGMVLFPLIIKEFRTGTLEGLRFALGVYKENGVLLPMIKLLFVVVFVDLFWWIVWPVIILSKWLYASNK